MFPRKKYAEMSSLPVGGLTRVCNSCIVTSFRSVGSAHSTKSLSYVALRTNFRELEILRHFRDLLRWVERVVELTFLYSSSRNATGVRFYRAMGWVGLRENL